MVGVLKYIVPFAPGRIPVGVPLFRVAVASLFYTGVGLEHCAHSEGGPYMRNSGYYITGDHS